MKFLLIFLLVIGGIANADTVQWSKGYTADCDNPTEREDGTVMSAAEISHIIYQIIPASGSSLRTRIAKFLSGEPGFSKRSLIFFAGVVAGIGFHAADY